MTKFLSVTLMALLLAAGAVVAADAVRSGLEPGESPAPFNVKDITGPSKGKSLCYRCQYGGNPVVCVFTRKMTDEVAALVKDLDAVVAANKADKKMCGFTVLLTDDADAGAKELQKAAEAQGLKAIPLTVFDGTAGPGSYKIAKDAEVTVLMWVKSKVQVNHAFASASKLDKDTIKKIVDDTAKILK